jgi:hypothetical protein
MMHLRYILPVITDKPENYFLLSRQSATDRKFIFCSPDDRRQTGNLFSTLPTIGGRPEIYFLLSRQSATGQYIQYYNRLLPEKSFLPFILFRKYLT